MGNDAEVPVVSDPAKDPKRLAAFTRKVAMILNSLVRAGTIVRGQTAGIKGDTFSIPGITGGTVTTVSIVSANGFAGTVTNPTTTPAITLKTTVTGLIKGNGTAISAAIADTDYATPAGVVSYVGGYAQPLDADLTAIAALTGTNNIYYRSAANTWSSVTIGANMAFSGGVLSSTASGSGSVTTVSVTTANGVSGTVANPTTTPAITLTLGAITPTSVNGNTITTGTGTLTLSTFTVTAAANATISGTNTGNQTITLTGDVTGSGTGSFTATIGNGKVTLAKISNAGANSVWLGAGAAGIGAGYTENTFGTGLTVTGTVLSVSGNPSSLVYEDGTAPGGNTVASTAAETAFTSSYTVPANTLAVGSVIKVKLFGVYSTALVAGTIIVKLKIGSTTLLTTGTISALVGSTSNLGWTGEATLIVTAIGASGSIEAQGLAEFDTTATVGLLVNLTNTAVVGSIDTTTNETLTVTVTWGTSSASNTITLRQMLVEIATTGTVAITSTINGWEHPFTKPTIAGVTRVNTTGFTDSDDTNGLFIWRSGSLSASDNLTLAHNAIPGGAWNLDVRVQAMWADDAFATGGAHLYETSTGKIVCFGCQGTGTTQRLCINYFTNTTSFSSQPKTVNMTERPNWLRISYDGSTNLGFWWSIDGYSWTKYTGTAKTAFFTTGPSHAGFFLDPYGTNIATGIKCMSLTCN